MTVSIDGKTESTEETILRVDDIHRTFVGRSRGKKISTFAVRGVSLSIHKGETIGLVGESGCGKTTLARIIAGLEHPTRGKMTFHSVPLKFTRAIRKKISMVFQDPYASLNPRMATASIIREPMHMLSKEELDKRLKDFAVEGDEMSDLPRGWIKRIALKFESKRRKHEREYAAALLELVALRPEWALRYPHEFSGGQRQRIGIARALATAPELLVLDEPVSALDVSVQAGVITLLQKLREDSDLAMLFISHDLRVVRHLCDRVVVMYLGQVMEDAPSDILFEHPRHPYTRALIASVPARPGEVEIVEAVVEGSDFDFASVGEDSSQEAVLPFSVIRGELPSPTNPPQGCPFRTRCERAAEECKTKPPLAKMTDGRLVACHFPY